MTTDNNMTNNAAYLAVNNSSHNYRYTIKTIKALIIIWSGVKINVLVGVKLNC